MSLSPANLPPVSLPPRALRLAAACYPIDAPADWPALASKLARWVADAAARGADIAVLPEYAGLEAALALAPERKSISEWCTASAEVGDRYAALCAQLAQDHRLTLLSGSAPANADGRLVNRAWLCCPNGEIIAQDKVMLTPWERAHTPLTPGAPPRALDTPAGRLATLICYDAEFPPLADRLAPDILLVPSATEAPAGNARVRIGAQARALEGQCVTVHAALTGGTDLCEIIDVNTGAAGIYAPPDHPFPPDGILTQGAPDVPGWVIADLPAGALSATRSQGAVALRAHMDEARAAAESSAARPARTLRA